MWFRENVPLESNRQKCPTPNSILVLLHQSSNTRFNTVNLNNSTMKFDINLQRLLWMDLSPWPLASVTNQNYLGSFVHINKPRLTLHLQNQSLGAEWLWKSSPDESDTEPPYQPLTSDYCQHKSSAVCKAWMVLTVLRKMWSERTKAWAARWVLSCLQGFCSEYPIWQLIPYRTLPRDMVSCLES